VNEVKKSHLEDMTIFSQDARRLQETEVILQNALHRLHEMDEIRESELLGIKERIDSEFYYSDEVFEKVIDDIFPEQELKKIVEKRIKAESYLTEVKRLDEENELDLAKLLKIKERINSGYYSSDEVLNRVVEDLANVLEA
jgi:hypothetical protein